MNDSKNKEIFSKDYLSCAPEFGESQTDVRGERMAGLISPADPKYRGNNGLQLRGQEWTQSVDRGQWTVQAMIEVRTHLLY